METPQIPEDFIADWKKKHFAPVVRDKAWETLKARTLKAGEPTNPISVASGGELMVEQFGIIGFIYAVKACPDEKQKNGRTIKTIYQCPLIESRETGTGKFDEWLKNVQRFIALKYKEPFAVSSITNQGLYKHLEKMKIPVAVQQEDGWRLYNVKVEKKRV